MKSISEMLGVKRATGVSELSGYFIYQEKKRTIYYDIFTKKAYLLLNKDLETYNRFYLRHMVTSIALFALLVITDNMLLSVSVALALHLLGCWLFRVKFLYNQPLVQNWVKPKEASYIDTRASEVSYLFAVAIIVAGLLLAGLIASDILSGKPRDMLNTSAMVALIVVGVVVSILHIIIIFRKYRNEHRK